MKNEFQTKFVQIYETWYVCDDIYKNIYGFFAHFKLIYVNVSSKGFVMFCIFDVSLEETKHIYFW
jgi:hypothetical protein